jgi:hypothetical protein
LGLLISVAPLVGSTSHALTHENAFRQLEKTMWVWQDRILRPEDLESFVTTHNIRTLFLYVTPTAAETLLGHDAAARGTLQALRSRHRRIYALAGEPDWAFGPSNIPQHVDLLIRLQSVRPRLFDGIHLDVEPNALPDWHESTARARLIEGTLRFYDLVREHAPAISIDAAVNPIFAKLNDGDGTNFLRKLAMRVQSVSIMAYRNRIQSTLTWVAPAVAQVSASRAAWRLGVEVERNDGEPNTSWHKSSRDQFEPAMTELDGRARKLFPRSSYAGLVFHSFDGMRALVRA